MKRPAAAIPLLAVLTWLPSPLCSQPADEDGGTVPEHRVDSIFADVTGPTSPGCALTVMRDGAPIYERGYGMANLEYGIPITPHSVFHVASVSKHFTAMAVELLVDEGRVSWDDDIREYVPEVPDFGPTITLRHLVHHTSGIRDQWSLLEMAGWRWEADVVTQKDVLDITSRQTALNFPPGEQYLYSNTGFTLLAVVVERVTGKTLREFTTERIFEPLGMEATHFHDDHHMIVRNRAWAYEPDEDGAFGLRNSIPDFDVVGATSLFTTAHEMAAWDRNFYTGTVGGDDAIERLRSRFVLSSGDTIGYAHGLAVGTYRGLRREGHGGADAGYRTSFSRFPDERFSVVVLCNFPSADPGGRALRVADVYLEDRMEPTAEEEDPSEEEMSEARTVELSSAELQGYAGVYRGERPSQLVRLVVVDDSLRIDDGPALRPIGERRFALPDGEEVVFRDEDDSALVVEAPFGSARRHPIWDPDEAELELFAGAYESDELGTVYRLEVDDGALWMHHRKLESRRLRPAWEGGFTTRGYVIDFTGDGAVSHDGFRISSGRVWNVLFRRIEE